jgi:hypothetical protein
MFRSKKCSQMTRESKIFKLKSILTLYHIPRARLELVNRRLATKTAEAKAKAT